MPASRYDEFFRRHPVFTGDELARHLAARGGAGARTREAILSYHVKTGRLVRVRRGLFAVVPPGADPDSFPVDPYLIASRLTPDAVLSYHTALEFHGRAYSTWDYLVYSAGRPSPPMTFRSRIYRGARFPEALVRARRTTHGVLATERAGLPVRVTNLERTLVDILDRPRYAGGWEEIWRSLESVEFVDVEEIVHYVLLLQNATTAAKVGFYLEEHREALMVDSRSLETLSHHRPRRPHYLDGARNGRGTLVSDWNLVVPRELADREWEELA